jgi:hypothetical protein
MGFPAIMTERLIVVSADQGYVDTITSMAERAAVLDCTVYANDGETPNTTVHLLVSDESRQPVLDNLQSLLGNSDDWRITILPVKATIPRPEPEKKPAKSRAGAPSWGKAGRSSITTSPAMRASISAS